MVPLVLLTISAVSAGVGIIEGLEAMEKFENAKCKVNNAKIKLSNAIKQLENEREIFNRKAKEIAFLTKEAYELLYKFSKLMESFRVSVKISEKEKKDINELTIKVKEIKEILDGIKSEEVLEVVGKAVMVGYMSYIGTIGLATAIGTASTGTAIANLSGAALENALLAWLGGGAVSVGGGGIALGSFVLGSITIGPAIGIAGITLSKKAEKALTEAVMYEKEVEKRVTQLKIFTEKLKTVNCKLGEGIRVRKRILQKFKEKLEVVEIGRKNIKEIKTLISMAKTLKELFDKPIISREELI